MAFILSNLLSGVSSDLMILFEIGLMIVLGGIIAFIFKVLKQPRIPAYVIAGIILGPLALGIVQSSNVIMALSQIGVAFLLFFTGLELDLKSLKRDGKISSFIGVIEMLFIGIITFVVLLFLAFKFNNLELIYIVLIVAFSSTMVVIKMIADKDELNTLHGRIIMGVLLVQDIIAIFALTVLTSKLSFNTILYSLIKAALFIVIGFLLTKISKPVFKISARSNELMLIISLVFLFLFSMIAYAFGLSLVIGAFFAGVALANSDFKLDIKGRVHPLRDFFGAILFVALGVQLVWIPKQYWSLFLVLFVLIIVIKPLILIFSTRLLGYSNRTSFFIGNSLGQSSEFSLILLTQALILSHISKDLFSVLVFVTILTMSITGYFIHYEQQLFNLFSRIFKKVLSKLPTKKEELSYGKEMKKKIVLFGCHRMGGQILREFTKDKDDVLVVDFNPEIIRPLMHKRIPCIYGDYANPEIMEKVIKMKPEMIISTIPNVDDNIELIKKLKESGSKAIIIVAAEHIHEAIELYKIGADYVALPRVMSGIHMIELVNDLKKDRREVKRRELDLLNKIHYYLYKK